MRLRRFVLIAALSGLVAACGGDPSTPRASSSKPTNGTGTPTPSTGVSPAGNPTTGSPKPGSTPAATSPKPSVSATARTATLDKACVRRGANDDRQGLTVQTTPRGPYGFATVYSDGSDITSHPEYEPDGAGPIGGQGGSFADETGRGRAQWVVPPTAPLGPATVKVNLGGTIFDLAFTVVATTGTCR